MNSMNGWQELGTRAAVRRVWWRRSLRSPCALVMLLLGLAQLSSILLVPTGCTLRAAEPQAAPGLQLKYDADVRPLLQKYCFDCHSGEKPESGIALDRYREETARTTQRAAWQKINRQLQGRIMPPRDHDQPTDEERQKLLGWIQAYALTADCSGPVQPGRVTVRRLNRVEYNNTVRDLLGIDLKVADEFPSDDVGYGFDNIGDVLTIPPVLLERYLDAADRVARTTIVTGERENAPVKTAKGRDLPSQGKAPGIFDFPATAQYVLRAQASGDQAGPDPCRMSFSLDGKELQVFDVPNARNNPQWFELVVEVPAGKHEFAAAFLNDYYMPKAEDPKLRGDRNLTVQALAVIGPLGLNDEALPASHKRIVTRSVPKTAPAAERLQVATELLRPVASRAFRRAATPEELQRLASLVELAHQQGDSFERGMQVALQAILVSPQFLFKLERDPPPGEIRDLSDFELATRLSYFLWSSLPDDELFRAARDGHLRDPEKFAAQAQRLLLDPRADALVENFAGQWLQLRNLDQFLADKKQFPAFDDQLKAAMRRETELFFAHIMRSDRSVLEFLDADYTFINERLAKHYGLSGWMGEGFQRVNVDKAQRGGLLGQASILAVTSNPTRTSPVKRGKWVLENLFAAPPPPPPPNVPELADGKGKPLTGTLRQRMEQHRVNPACAACHQLMDPVGFGLENYDAIGAWREKDGEHPVDASGEFADGRKFQGPAELKTILLARQEEFRRCLAEKLLTYALGRGLEYYDVCAVNQIAKKVAEQDNRFSVLVREVVLSDAFRKRQGVPREAARP
ncbi:MAG: DUF1592 domain-containing protein [Planctomycetota bacterium]